MKDTIEGKPTLRLAAQSGTVVDEAEAEKGKRKSFSGGILRQELSDFLLSSKGGYVAFRHDSFTNTDLLVDSEGSYHELIPNLVERVCERWDLLEKRRVDSKYMEARIKAICFANSYNVLTEMVKNLPPWDGEDRIGKFFPEVLGCASCPRPYAEELGWYLWTSLAGYALQPGTKADYMPVLLGEGGVGKTELIERLCFTLPWEVAPCCASVDMNAGNEKFHISWRGLQIGRCDELEGFKKQSDATVKKRLTERRGRHRNLYEGKGVNFERQTLFVACSNNIDDIPKLEDDRRFLPIWLGKVGGYLAITPEFRDQCMAQAVVWLKSNLDPDGNIEVRWQPVCAAAKLHNIREGEIDSVYIELLRGAVDSMKLGDFKRSQDFIQSITTDKTKMASIYGEVTRVLKVYFKLRYDKHGPKHIGRGYWKDVDYQES